MNAEDMEEENMKDFLKNHSKTLFKWSVNIRTGKYLHTNKENIEFSRHIRANSRLKDGYAVCPGFSFN